MAIDLVAVLKLDDRMTSSLKNVAGAATIGFAAITAAAAVTVNEFSKFDTAIRKTGAIAGANATELEALKNSALDLGQSTSKSATEVANSMTSLAASGMNATNVMKAMPGIIAASEASGESLAVAAETVAGALNVWSLEAEQSTHVADVLAMAANMTASGITDMGYAFKYAGSPAAALGVTLEETAAAIGIMSNANIDGSSAGTALRASLLALNNPAKAQEKMMKALGFSATDAAGEFKSLSTMIGDMAKATEHMTEADKVATLGKLVGTEAVSGFLALMKAGPSEINKMTDALVNSNGASEATAKEMMAGIGGAVEEMMGTINSVAILVGEKLAPTVVSFARIVSNINFTPFIDAIGVVGGAAAHVAKLIEDNWSTIGPMLKPLVTIVAAIAGSFMLIGGASAIFLALSAAIGFISGPVAAVAVGIGAIVGALAILYDKVEPFRNKVTSVFDGLKVALGFEVNTPQMPKMAGDTGAMMLDEGNQAPQSVEYLEHASVISNAFKAIKEAASVAMDYVRSKLELLQPAISMLTQTFNNVKDVVTTVLSTLWGVAGPIFSLLGVAFSILADVAVMAFNNVIAPAFLMISTGVSAMWKILGPVLELFGQLLQGVGKIVLWLWDASFAPFLDYISSGMLAMADIVMPILESIDGIFSTIGGTISGVIDYVKTFVSSLGNIKVPEWVTGIGEKASNIVSKFVPGHYHGLDSVPYDGYTASLHRGETVLNAQEAKSYREGNSGGGGSVSIAKLADQIIVREDADIDRIADGLVSRILERRGVVY